MSAIETKNKQLSTVLVAIQLSYKEEVLTFLGGDLKKKKKRIWRKKILHILCSSPFKYPTSEKRP